MFQFANKMRIIRSLEHFIAIISITWNGLVWIFLWFKLLSRQNDFDLQTRTLENHFTQMIR